MGLILYGQWIQQALEEGDWLRTSAISSQKKTRKAKRPEVDLPALVEPVEHGILDPTKYKLLWAKRWRDPLQHINYKEGLVALSSLKRTGRVSSLCHSTKLTLSDNLVVVLAFEKGRSNSPSINKLCRAAAAYQCGLDICWRLRHTESPRNVSDGPSRIFEKTRKPEVKYIECKRVGYRSELLLSNYLDRSSKPFQGTCVAPPGLEFLGDTSKARSVSKHADGEEDPQDNAPFVTQLSQEGGKRCLSLVSHGRLSSRASLPPSMADSKAARSSDGNGTFLEVFSGSGNLSSACGNKGIGVVGKIDIKTKPGLRFDSAKFTEFFGEFYYFWVVCLHPLWHSMHRIFSGT